MHYILDNVKKNIYIIKNVTLLYLVFVSTHENMITVSVREVQTRAYARSSYFPAQKSREISTSITPNVYDIGEVGHGRPSERASLLRRLQWKEKYRGERGRKEEAGLQRTGGAPQPAATRCKMRNAWESRRAKGTYHRGSRRGRWFSSSRSIAPYRWWRDGNPVAYLWRSPGGPRMASGPIYSNPRAFYRCVYAIAFGARSWNFERAIVSPPLNA